MNDEDGYRTVLGSGLGPWLISDRPKGSDFESFPRRAQCPRYRQRGLAPTSRSEYIQGREISMHITVKAGWDAEAEVWYIASTDLPGLHLEGATPQELYNQLPRAIEDLLEGIGQQKVLFKFIIPGHKSVPGHVQIAA